MPEPTQQSLETARDILSESWAIDLHTHLGLWETRGLPASDDPLGHYIGDARIAEIAQQMVDANCRAAWINLTSDIPIIALGQPGNKSRDFAKGEAWDEYKRLMQELNALLKVLPAEIARTPGDMARINGAGRLALLMSCEGAHMVEEDLSRLEEMAADGLTKFQPIHYAHCTIGDAQTDPPVFGGLSPFGRDAIALARQLGLVIDCAHATLDATRHMAEVAGGPIALSHGLMRFSTAGSGSGMGSGATSKRWLSDEHVRFIGQTGGVIGTWCPTAPIGAHDADQFVAAVMAMINVAGIEHVGWATDHIDVGMGPWFRDYRDFEAIIARLTEAGLSRADMEKFIGGNALRVWEEARGAAA